MMTMLLLMMKMVMAWMFQGEVGVHVGMPFEHDER